MNSEATGLVFKKRDDRINDNGPSRQAEPGQLVDDAFPGTGGEENCSVSTLEDLAYRLELALQEVLLGEYGPQDCL